MTHHLLHTACREALKAQKKKQAKQDTFHTQHSACTSKHCTHTSAQLLLL
jgi:hypothetical protein